VLVTIHPKGPRLAGGTRGASPAATGSFAAHASGNIAVDQRLRAEPMREEQGPAADPALVPGKNELDGQRSYVSGSVRNTPGQEEGPDEGTVDPDAALAPIVMPGEDRLRGRRPLAGVGEPWHHVNAEAVGEPARVGLVGGSCLGANAFRDLKHLLVVQPSQRLPGRAPRGGHLVLGWRRPVQPRRSPRLRARKGRLLLGPHDARVGSPRMRRRVPPASTLPVRAAWGLRRSHPRSCDVGARCVIVLRRCHLRDRNLLSNAPSIQC
jgi:hypothetical protein